MRIILKAHRLTRPTFILRPPVRIATALLLSLCGIDFSASPAIAQTEHEAVQSIELSKGWELVSDGNRYPVVPNDSWETDLGVDFDGQAIYENKLPDLGRFDSARRLMIRFEAIATHATVSIDDVKVGEHLGGWTPFQFDITDQYRPGATIRVEVDERVGHNTQGFLPIVVPHFGGMWKPPSLTIVSNGVALDRDRLFASGFGKGNDLQVVAPVIDLLDEGIEYRIGARILPANADIADSLSSNLEKGWTWSNRFSSNPIPPDEVDGNSPWPHQAGARLTLKPETVRRWSPADPYLYSLEIILLDVDSRKVLDRVVTRAAIRHIATNGAAFQLNGELMEVRGVLNWGYAPPRLAPSLDEAFIREELKVARDAGFNLMKFCLWIPPRRYLELCDEMGMLAWVEYPTWHPKLTEEYLVELQREYDEFYFYERNHPSVVLRSLTCETGPSAQLPVLQALYDRAHELIPHSIVEDDSSWIGWHRVHDFYDDHPYGNNHTWSATLDRLRTHIGERELKPLALGEAIAADTWTTSQRPAAWTDEQWETHRLMSLPQQQTYLEELESLLGEDAVEAMKRDSFEYAHQMRKYQVEQYRQEMPGQGYVVSVIRDFPLAAMGLVDFSGNFKWPSDRWSWHGDAMLVLDTKNDRRSGRESERFIYEIELIGALSSKLDVELLSLDDEPEVVARQQIDFHSSVDSRSNLVQQARCSTWETALVLPKVEQPQRFTLRATCQVDDKPIINQWPIWVVPQNSGSNLHFQVDNGVADDDPLQATLQDIGTVGNPEEKSGAIVVTRQLDEGLLDAIISGANVLLLTQGEVGAPPVSDHWFLRGAVAVARNPHLDNATASLIADLQTFDLAGPVIMSPDYLDETTPLALLWDNHDREDYRSHALAWYSQIGKGRLLVSSLNHDLDRGPASGYVLRRFAEVLIADETTPRSLSASTIDRMRRDILDNRVELPRRGWQFKPDPESKGASEEWFAIGHDRSSWSPIEIGQHWDSQGFGAVDGLGWYARDIKLPQDAKFLTFTGVDDSFLLYVDGQFAGKGGDRETRVDAFSKTITLEIPAASQRKPEIHVVIAVDDWQGAGGIFRPVYVSRSPLKNDAPLLRRAQSALEDK